MSTSYLVIDVEALLDKSEVGKAAAAMLEQRTTEAQTKIDGLRKQASNAKGMMQKQLTDEAKALADSARQGLSDARFTLRNAVLGRAEAEIRRIADERGIKLVLERRMVVLFDEDADITGAVIEAIDAAGPLEI